MFCRPAAPFEKWCFRVHHCDNSSRGWPRGRNEIHLPYKPPTMHVFFQEGFLASNVPYRENQRNGSSRKSLDLQRGSTQFFFLSRILQKSKGNWSWKEMCEVSVWWKVRGFYGKIKIAHFFLAFRWSENSVQFDSQMQCRITRVLHNSCTVFFCRPKKSVFRCGIVGTVEWIRDRVRGWDSEIFKLH